MSTITGTDQTGLIKAVRTDVDGNLIVVQIDTYRSKVVLYGDSMVAQAATVTLVTFTVPAGKRFYFKGVSVGGGEEGEFSFEINAGRIGLWRNSGSTRSAVITFPEQPEASAAAIINVIVTNKSNKTRQFEATIYGYTLTV